MEIYIEYVILDNLVIDLIILYLTKKTLNLKISRINMFLSAMLGTAGAVGMPLIPLPSYFMFIIKLALGVLMVSTLKLYKGVKEFVLCFILFLTYTFVLGGACFGVLYMFNLNTSVNGLVINGFEMPISIFIALISIYLYILFKVVAISKKKRQMAVNLIGINIHHNSIAYKLTAFVDTGNMVYDNGKPVNLISFNAFKKIFKTVKLEDVLLKQVSDDFLTNAHYINLQTANSNNKILVFNTKLELCEGAKATVIENAVVGLTLKNFAGNFDCIIHPAVLRREL